MNEKELKFEHCEVDVRIQETKVRDSKIQLEQGYKRLASEFEKEYAILKSNYERELIRFERERTFVSFARDELTRGFRD